MPINVYIPWKIIAASPDMMDITFNNRRFPFTWRSSLAISVYEPPQDELPAPLCGQKISFVKVTCSLTGYQINGSESGGQVTFGNMPIEEVTRLATEYLGCYGALLNVAFFPSGRGFVNLTDAPNVSQLPLILDFTPKNRELIRSITEGGELLTGSSRSIGIDESMTTTDKNETTVGLEAGYEKAGVKAVGKIEHTWGTTTEDKRGLTLGEGETNTSKRVHSTTMDQLYSLLTGYHTGTNRATVIMLARPGTMQPTDRRTFAQGLRMLEGIQDFVFVVSRPEDQESLCIEASLHTGHYPEATELVGETETNVRRPFTFNVTARVRGGSEGLFSFQGETMEFPRDVGDTFILPAGWIIDIDAPGTVNGIGRGTDRTRTIPATSDGVVANRFDLNAIRLNDRTVQVRGQVTARGGYDFSSGPDTLVDIDFIVHAIQSEATGVQQVANPNQMLVTKRGLSVCYRTIDGCPEVFEPPNFANVFDSMDTPRWFDTAMRPGTFDSLRSSLIEGTAFERGEEGRPFVETNYFSRRIADKIPQEIAFISVSQAIDLKQYGEQAVNLLANANIKQVLSIDSKRAASHAGLKSDAMLKIRNELLVYIEKRLSGDDKGYNDRVGMKTSS